MRHFFSTKIIFFGFLLFIISCGEKNNSSTNTVVESKPIPVNTSGQHFKLLSPQESGVTFSNSIIENYDYNIVNFEYLYNGGGVAIGDVNNDGLPDLYFSGTFVPNKLYLNKGNLKFVDITEQAGVEAKVGFKTGVTMADVNNDGWLDIYVCRTSKTDDKQKDNLLFINNKNANEISFTESAAKFGLKDNSNTNHANFFDYDKDGDLDLYIINHPPDFKAGLRLRVIQNPDGTFTKTDDPRSEFESDRLYKNNNGKFVDVTKQAGLENSAFGLSATVSDLNQDGYLDIFVANDYVEPDHVYINNRNGTFTDEYNSYLRHSSQNSMGSDIADINNDGLVDIMVMDMIANNPRRYKDLMNQMRKDRYAQMVQYGYGHQVVRNVLQLNNGNGTFSEIGQLAGISATDWSWGSLIADFDNDGWKDVHIANGYRRDITNLDYVAYLRDSIAKTGGVTKARFPDINTFLDMVPSTKLKNFAYRNNSDLTFSEVTDSWGMGQATFSNGSAYGDLDNDGDLDLVINNIIDPAFVYENKSGGNNYLQLKLKGSSKNPFALGTKVTIYSNDQIQYQEMNLTHGFFSGSEPLIHFGLGKNSTVDKIEILWDNGKTHVIDNTKANQRLEVNISQSNNKPVRQVGKEISNQKNVFVEKSNNLNLNFLHKENKFDDLNRERLLPHKLSTLGPHISKADVNGDGLEDFYIGGASNSSGSLFIQQSNSTFQTSSDATWNADKTYEDLESIFFDADGDKDLDLYIVSGGNAAQFNSPLYQDRLYLNDGKGNFSKSNNALPKNNSSGACLASFDYDQDGDEDIFVGGRTSPGKYPTAPTSFILQNNNGTFTDVTTQVAPQLSNIGMVTDLQFADVDKNGTTEMILTGEYLPITIFNFDGKKFTNATAQFGLQNTNGWWNCFNLQDFDNDGDLDIMAGNTGQNTRLNASENEPLTLYASDFDGNNSIDPIMSYTLNGKQYPLPLRDNIFLQIPSLKKKFNRYYLYNRAEMKDLFSAQKLSKATQLQIKTLSSSFLKNENGKFSISNLPSEAQVAPVQEIITADLNDDSHLDAIVVGNNDGAEVETGVYDASNGTVLLGDGKGNFKAAPNMLNGFWANQQARDIVELKLANGKTVFLIGNNNGKLQAFVKDGNEVPLQ